MGSTPPLGVRENALRYNLIFSEGPGILAEPARKENPSTTPIAPPMPDTTTTHDWANDNLQSLQSHILAEEQTHPEATGDFSAKTSKSVWK